MKKRANILIVGVGSIGERHLRCFMRTQRAVPAICETRSELRSRIANRYGVQSVYGDYSAALSSDPDAVVICTPSNLHVPLAVQAVRSGTHVLIEKPLSTSLDGVEELIRLVEAQGTIAAVAYIHRSNPILQAMRSALVSGRFGEPLHVVVSSGQHFPSFRPAYRDIYYANRSCGGGAIQDALTHLINAIEWLVGPASKVAADASHQSLDGVEVEDTVNLIARHGRVLASYSLNQYQAPNETTITVACENGTVRYQAHRFRWSWQTDSVDHWHHEQFEPLERDDVATLQAAYFLDAIDGRRLPTCSLAEGVHTLRVNLAVLQAADEHRWIDVA